MSELNPALAELFAYMDRTRDALMDYAMKMNASFAQIRPHQDAWSAADILAHLALVESFVAGMVAEALARARSDGVTGPSASAGSVLGSLDKWRVPEPVTKIVASPRVTPREPKSVENSLASLAESRDRLKRALAEASDIDLSAIKRPHPVLHDLDMYQWALFVAQHEERHRLQMERTLAEVTELAAESAPIV